MSPDQARTHAAATIAAQAGDLRTGHDGPTGWLVAELDAARRTIRDQRRRIADLESALQIQRREDADHAREVATGGRLEAGPLLAHLHDDGLL